MNILALEWMLAESRASRRAANTRARVSAPHAGWHRLGRGSQNVMMKMNWAEQVVLVTGGTGSFGKKFVEIMLNEYRPHKLIIFSRDELKQHEMRAAGIDHPSLRYFLGDVRDAQRLERALSDVTVVVHAAALKQVSACEQNPFEAVQTN